ncbi:hypothetical protein [Streptomyces sp. NPDC001292]|uniref:hypothetical protein n=1 Tax=Streptomyces sp. NPDC001292 TaxID=3364558 RepID=UPI003690AD99
MRSGGLDTLLRDLTDRAVEDVPGAAACSITVRRDHRLLTLAGSGGLPSGLVLRQYENGNGPCVTAAGTGAEQYTSSTAPTWPPRPAGPRTRPTRCPSGCGAYWRSRSS